MRANGPGPARRRVMYGTEKRKAAARLASAGRVPAHPPPPLPRGSRVCARVAPRAQRQQRPRSGTPTSRPASMPALATPLAAACLQPAVARAAPRPARAAAHARRAAGPLLARPAVPVLTSLSGAARPGAAASRAVRCRAANAAAPATAAPGEAAGRAVAPSPAVLAVALRAAAQLGAGLAACASGLRQRRRVASLCGPTAFSPPRLR